MEVSLQEFLDWIVVPIVLWNIWLSKETQALRVSVAVNEANDTTTNTLIVGLGEKIDKLSEQITEIHTDVELLKRDK